MARRRKKPTKTHIPSLAGEEWALVNGTEDFYISNLGRFKRITAKGDSLRKVSIDPDGYRRVNIGHNKLRLHRLVAEHFVPNPNNYDVVDHIDADKGNNKASNLEWVTQAENVRRAVAMGLLTGGESTQVIAIDNSDRMCYLFSNMAECASNLNLKERSVGKAANGKQKTVSGYSIIKVNGFEDRRRDT